MGSRAESKECPKWAIRERGCRRANNRRQARLALSFFPENHLYRPNPLFPLHSTSNCGPSCSIWPIDFFGVLSFITFETWLCQLVLASQLWHISKHPFQLSREYLILGKTPSLVGSFFTSDYTYSLLRSFRKSPWSLGSSRHVSATHDAICHLTLMFR